ncbi:TniQ family protein [Pseudomonas lundensis]|uniref:TniQ family protein n=1 Tax=Pseudomonas lundensis TaxID=86185 RepID=UPI0030BA1966
MQLKLHFFPAAFPDETLHSVISRYARLCGVRNCQAAFAGLKSAAAFSQNVAFPSHLGDFVDALPSGTELSVAEVLMRHTLLPYYAPFLRMSQVEQARTLMTADGKGLMLKLGVNASRIGFASRVRLCPECIAQDQAQRGVAYWHRVHMLPGVLVCPHHGTSLRILDPRWLSRSSRQLNLPSDENVQAHTVHLDTPLRCMPPLHEIALRSLQVLESEVTALSAEAVRYTLLQRATQLNLASDNHRLHLHMLAQHMADFFATLPREWEFSILGDVRAGTPASWVTKLLRTPITSHHPLKL